ncbi:MAG: hypothetical protein KDJ29_17150 [Hyphomicrobiales bacterium]|nr:hypothetical protein [Hyphomicrobiales bacterium]
MLKIITAATLLAGVMTLGAITPGEAARMRTVTCASGKTIQVTDSQSKAQACARAGALKSRAKGQQAKTGNPCKPSGTTKGCRDWILGKPKPKPRPK